jgi:Asp-tRNA(Asn)/Glu-tRNA(Gln) amidotransferase A subunit family amidase
MFDTNSIKLKKILNKWLEPFDALLVPSIPEMAELLKVSYSSYYAHNDQHISLSSFVEFATFSSLPVLNIPIGFSPSFEPFRKNGLPIGASFITNKDKLMNTLKIADIYEINFGFKYINQLPFTTPLKFDIDFNDKTWFSSFISIVLSFLKSIQRWLSEFKRFLIG